MSFELFQLAPSLNIDEVALRKIYLEIQKENHPDFGTELTVSEKANQYYKILKSPLKRAAYLITDFYGYDLNINKLGNDFLMEMMELGELIEESNTSLQKQELQEQLNQLKQDFEMEFSQIQQQWGEQNISEITEDLWLKLIVWYQKQQYVERLRKLLNNISEM